MKHLILLAFIAILSFSCSNENREYKSLIKEQAFIDDLNSFDSTATYQCIGKTDSSYVFIIKQNDSIFIYNVEKTPSIKFIYDIKYAGQYVK